VNLTMGATMKRKIWMSTGLALLLGGAAVAALSPGETVYVKVRNTRIFQKPDPSASLVGKPQQPGAALVWKGRVQGAALPWQQVTVNGKRGYVLGSNLSLTKPGDDLEASDGVAHVETGASSGDAVKALGEGAQSYAANHSEQDEAKVAKQLQTLEAISDRVTDDLVTRHNAALGGKVAAR
jgi:hypothetical protein